MSTVTRLQVNHGRIACPNRGNIALDVCLYCKHLLNVDLDVNHPFIDCTPPVKDRAQEAQVNNATHERAKYARSKQPIAHCVIEAIVEHCLSHPEWGIDHIRDALSDDGITISRRKIGNVLEQEGLVHQADRLRNLMSLVTTNQIEPDEHQVEALGKYDACYRDRAIIGTAPFENILFTTVQAYGKKRNAAEYTPMYAEFAIDTYSGYTFGLLCESHIDMNALILLQHYLLPEAEKLGTQIRQVFTAPSSRFTGTQLEAYLTDYNTKHTQLKKLPGLAEQFYDVFWNKWVHGQLPTTSPREAPNAQQRLQESLTVFNDSTMLMGFPNLGQTPKERIDSYKKELLEISDGNSLRD